jgi:hypothetical protein
MAASGRSGGGHSGLGGALARPPGTHWGSPISTVISFPDYLRAVGETDDAAPVAGLVDGVRDVEPTGEFKRWIARASVVGPNCVPLIILVVPVLQLAVHGFLSLGLQGRYRPLL